MSRGHVSRGRALRTGVAWDARSGFKVKGRKLVEDGERPGVYTVRSWADERHPGRFVHVPPPDGLSYRPGPPPMHAIGARVDLSYVIASDTHPLNGGYTMQPSDPLGPTVLERRPAPTTLGALVGPLTVDGLGVFT